MSHADPHEPVDALLAQWLQARQDGQPVDGETLRQQHPESAAEVAAFLDDYQQVDRRFEPLRRLAGTVPVSAAELPTLGQDDTAVTELPKVGSSFGDYDLLAEVARGGMGVVYKARQRSLNRVIALKMVLGGGRVSSTDRERFLVEARAVARLNHPHIVPIYEVGEHHGQPYFTMEFFAGDSLRGRIEEFRSDPRAIARLMATVARAVEHAHRRGILHRDLKPGNVLLDERREPHVTDFGLAKRLDEESDLTQAGAIVGTPSYMAPEQANAQTDLTTAVDVYGLGAVLYELLTGRPPFRGQTPMETMLSVMAQEPLRPRKLDGHVDPDLETICLKCLAKDPLARYGSADALADDLERWLAGEPIEARPASLSERVAKWARRQPVLAGALGAAALLALGLLTAAGLSWRNAELRAEAIADLGEANQQLAVANGDVDKAKSLAEKQRALAERQKQLGDEQKQLADQTRQEVDRLKQAAEVETAKAAAAQKQRELAEQQARRTAYAADMQLAHAAWQTGNMATLTELVTRHREEAGQGDLRGFEWHYLNRQLHGARRSWQVSQEATPGVVLGLAISPDGKTVATAATGGKIKLWSMADGRLVRTIDAGQALLAGLSFADEGRKLVAVVQQPADGRLLFKRNVDRLMKKEKFSPVLLAEQFEFRTWTLGEASAPLVEPFDPARLRCTVSPLFSGSGLCVAPHEGHMLSVMSLTTSPDGKYLAVAGMTTQGLGEPAKVSDERAGGALIVWDILRGEMHAQQKTPHGIMAAAFSPDSRWLATGDTDGTICVAEPGVATPRHRLSGHHSWVLALRFNADGSRLASGAADGLLLVWDVEGGRETSRLRGHAESVRRAEFSPDGQTLVSADQDTVKVWDLDRKDNPNVLRGSIGRISALAFSADGGELTSAHSSGDVRTWRVADGQSLHTVNVNSNLFSVLSSDGKNLAWQEVRGSDEFMVRDLASGKQCHVAWKDHHPLMFTLSRDDRFVSVGCFKSGDLGVWQVADGKLLATLPGGKGFRLPHAFSPDGTSLATVRENAVVLWDWRSGTSRRLWESKEDVVNRLAFADDNSQLAIVIGDVVKIWDLSADRLRVECRTAGMGVVNLAFSPDGQRLAIAGAGTGQQGVLKLWDTASGREVFSAALPPGMLTAMALSLDGQRLAAAMAPSVLSSGSAPAEIYIWDATPETADGSDHGAPAKGTTDHTKDTDQGKAGGAKESGAGESRARE